MRPKYLLAVAIGTTVNASSFAATGPGESSSVQGEPGQTEQVSQQENSKGAWKFILSGNTWTTLLSSFLAFQKFCNSLFHLCSYN